MLGPRKAQRKGFIMIRMIHLPAINKRFTLKAYVAAIMTAKANPSRLFKHGLTCWWSCDGAEIMEQFRAGMHERINQAIPYAERGLTK